MTHLLAILASTSTWIHMITPESSIVHDHIISTPVSSSYTKLSPFSIDCNIVRKDFLQTRSRCPQETKVILTILLYRRLTSLHHPDTIDYREYMFVIPVDIPDTVIHNSPRTTTNSVSPLATQLSHIEFCRFSMQQLFHAMRSQHMVEH